MNSIRLYLYIMLVRIVPRSLRWNNAIFYNHGSSKSGNTEYYQELNLACHSYNFLKEHCQNNMYSGNSIQLSAKFSPMGITLGLPICQVIRKMGAIPQCVLDNTDYLSGYYTLFYKRKVDDLMCTFELHFHKSKLFLFHIKVYDGGKAEKGKKQDFIQFLLQSSRENQLKEKIGKSEDPKYFRDNLNQLICGIEHLFSTVFIVSNPNSASLNELLAVKYLKMKADSSSANGETFSRMFVDSHASL